MLDKYKREIKYLRISLTDLCNLRCLYCMPEQGVCKRQHTDMMTEEEMLRAVKVAAKIGIRKIRLTGGEPLVKKNIIDIVSKIRDIDGIEEICLTTNGSYLSKYAKDLKSVGLDRINISLDTLDKDKFKYITRIGNIEDTLRGIDAALETNFKKVKINTVLIGGFNDDEIVDIANLTLKQETDVRFIELMPMYDGGYFGKEAFIPSKVVLEKIKSYYKGVFENDDKILTDVTTADNVIAKLYRINGAKANVGLISPVNNHFCSMCNRIRLTSDGKLKPCLHSSEEISIKNLNEEEMEKRFVEAILSKPKSHDVLSFENRSKANRNMNEIGG